jgi:hypothetical protein
MGRGFTGRRGVAPKSSAVIPTGMPRWVRALQRRQSITHGLDTTLASISPHFQHRGSMSSGATGPIGWEAYGSVTTVPSTASPTPQR